MNNLLYLFLDTVTTTEAETTTEVVDQASNSPHFYSLIEMIVWYSLFGLLVVLLILYFVNHRSFYNSFHKAQIRLGKEYTKLSTSKGLLTRIPRTYRIVEKAMVETDLVKEKLSLAECDEALDIAKDLLERLTKPETLSKENEEKFINDLGNLNSKLAVVYSLIKK